MFSLLSAEYGVYCANLDRERGSETYLIFQATSLLYTTIHNRNYKGLHFPLLLPVCSFSFTFAHYNLNRWTLVHSLLALLLLEFCSPPSAGSMRFLEASILTLSLFYGLTLAQPSTPPSSTDGQLIEGQ